VARRILAAIGTSMQTMKLCSDEILQFLTGDTS